MPGAGSAAVKTYESLGTFYLGRKVDAAKGTVTTEPALYDSRDLVTHGVIVDMTGSGKTGLGITLIEEALIDNIPVLAIDQIKSDPAARRVAVSALAAGGPGADAVLRRRPASLSNPDEVEAAFRARLQLVQREQRDAKTAELREKCAPQTARLTAAIARAETAVQREQRQRSAQMVQTAVSVGSTILGALLGRKTLSVTNIGHATIAALDAGPSPTRALTSVTIKPTSARIAIDRVLLVWVPQ